MAIKTIHEFSPSDERARFRMNGENYRATQLQRDDEHGLSVWAIRVRRDGQDYRRANSSMWLTVAGSLERFPTPSTIALAKYARELYGEITTAAPAPAPVRPTVTHVIPMAPASSYRSEQYGVLYSSAFVYRTSKSSYPTRLDLWSNQQRKNARNGEPVRYGDYGPIDGGNGRYLDPGNVATDDAVSLLLSPESISITAQSNGTGHADSGQVWAEQAAVIRPGDTLVLVYITEQCRTETWTATFSNNGHGSGKRVES